jgi:hypothetical protein
MLSPLALFGSENVHKVLLRDVTQSEGVRENQLVGYGLVAGLARTGDTQQTFFTVQTLANALTRMGSADRAWRRGRRLCHCKPAAVRTAGHEARRDCVRRHCREATCDQME